MRDDRRRELTPRELHRQRRKEQIARRRLVAALVLLGLIILIIVLVATCGSKDEVTTTTTTEGETTTTTLTATSFTADLTGTDTEGTGTFTLTYDPENEALAFDLMLDGVNAPTVANIYETGDDGKGTVVYVIYADDTESGDYTGRLAEGTIEVASLTGSLEGGTIGDLIQLIRDGKAYVGVGTKDTPVDAIKGDLVETTTGSTDTSDDTGSSDTTDDTSSSDTTDTTS
jgi:hypothetical protein